MSLGESDRPSSYLFVSYASVDRERVVQVVDALRAAGVGIWIDQHDIRGGAQYGIEIGDGIRGCAALALMCSDASLASRNVRQEIMLAWKYHRPYLPLLLERTVFPQDIEYWLEGSQWIEVLERPEAEWLPRVLGALRQIESPGGQSLPGVQLPASVPAAATPPAATAGRSNLPSPSPIVGRLRERLEIADLVRDGAERLVTLTGPG
ncbi:MAG: toll/interleukin-1 receptor domain-containing protein, partial [Vicinamibacterales bacterium]